MVKIGIDDLFNVYNSPEFSYAIINELIPKEVLPTVLDLYNSKDTDNRIMAEEIAKQYIK